jgi:hypothetical protein
MSKLRPWTEEELQLVEACWARGESASEIASRLPGRTRSAIIGIVNRNHYKRANKAARSAPVAPLRNPARLTATQRKSHIASYLATSAAPITLAGPAWSHPSNARAA